MRVALILTGIGLAAAGLGALVDATTSVEHTFLIGESFGADTAVAWCATIATTSFVAACVALRAVRPKRDDHVAGLSILGIVLVVTIGGIVVLGSWFHVGTYSQLPSGVIMRERMGFPENPREFYRRDGVSLSLLGVEY
jgi:hypothetical protein